MGLAGISEEEIAANDDLAVGLKSGGIGGVVERNAEGEGAIDGGCGGERWADREHGGRGCGRADGVGDDTGVSPALGELDVGQKECVRGGAGKSDAVFAPLVGEWERAAGGGGEGGVTADGLERGGGGDRDRRRARGGGGSEDRAGKTDGDGGVGRGGYSEEPLSRRRDAVAPDGAVEGGRNATGVADGDELVVEERRALDADGGRSWLLRPCDGVGGGEGVGAAGGEVEAATVGGGLEESRKLESRHRRGAVVGRLNSWASRDEVWRAVDEAAARARAADLRAGPREAVEGVVGGARVVGRDECAVAPGDGVDASAGGAAGGPGDRIGRGEDEAGFADGDPETGAAGCAVADADEPAGGEAGAARRPRGAVGRGEDSALLADGDPLAGGVSDAPERNGHAGVLDLPGILGVRGAGKREGGKEDEGRSGERGAEVLWNWDSEIGTHSSYLGYRRGKVYSMRNGLDPSARSDF